MSQIAHSLVHKALTHSHCLTGFLQQIFEENAQIHFLSWRPGLQSSQLACVLCNERESTEDSPPPLMSHSYHCACFPMCKGDLFSGKVSWFILIASFTGFRKSWKLVNYMHGFNLWEDEGEGRKIPQEFAVRHLKGVTQEHPLSLILAATMWTALLQLPTSPQMMDSHLWNHEPQ